MALYIFIIKPSQFYACLQALVNELTQKSATIGYGKYGFILGCAF
jgi:hypothetical protein